MQRVSCGSSTAFFQKVMFHLVHLKLACSSLGVMKTYTNNVRMEKKAREREKARARRQGSVCEGTFFGLCVERDKV